MSQKKENQHSQREPCDEIVRLPSSNTVMLSDTTKSIRWLIQTLDHVDFFSRINWTL